MTDDLHYDWLKDRACPHCNNNLVPDWVWASSWQDNIDDWQDYATWFLVCEECQINFVDEEGELVECI